MRTGVSIQDVVDALDSTSDELSSYVNRVTGEVRSVLHEELRLAEAEDDPDMPEWQQDAVSSAKEVLDSRDWIELPSKVDIHEWDIMDRFGGSLPREQQTEVRSAIRGNGAFRNFKGTLRRLGIEDAWFDFKRLALEGIARGWLEEHDLQPAEGADGNLATKSDLGMLNDFDFDNFWKRSTYADQHYVDTPLTPEKVGLAESKLGFRLPKAYVALMQHQNGGIPRRTNHRAEPTSWSQDHIAITGLYSIGSARKYSLCGEYSSQFWIDEWGYPPIGIYFADCPSAGHDMLCLDYSECGVDGEPRVVHVDQERDYKITIVAPSFEHFVRGLEGNEAFDDA